jgi:putative oxidoreductase
MSLFARALESNAPAATLLIRFVVGLVFVSEGVQKFLYPDEVGAGRFAKIPIPNPESTASIVGFFEILCGVLVIVGLFTRFAALPLIAVMLTALLTTKLPILLGSEFMGFSVRKVSYYGIWGFLHESRTDLAMLFSALFLLLAGAGKWSIDSLLTARLGQDG